VQVDNARSGATSEETMKTAQKPLEKKQTEKEQAVMYEQKERNMLSASPRDTSSVMEISSITKRLPLGRGQIDILKGISFDVKRGEMLALVGPSGSGKSTLLGILAGLDHPTSGHVVLDGIDIAQMPEGKVATVRNRKIGMVFQAYNLITTLTAQENVEIPLYVGKHPGLPSARARALLELVGLSHRLLHRPAQLSGGEQQRVAIARALAADPALIIADEPTGNLDRQNGQNLLNLIADLRAQTGKIFILATHDLAVATHADRVIHLVDGVISEIHQQDGEVTR
jgi:putative ABC transport system ATP-binding protein